MGANIDITFNSEGFKQILCSEGLKAVLEREAQKIEQKANANLTDPNSEGYTHKVTYSGRMKGTSSPGRNVAFVYAIDKAATNDEAENKSLSRSV